MDDLHERQTGTTVPHNRCRQLGQENLISPSHDDMLLGADTYVGHILTMTTPSVCKVWS